MNKNILNRFNKPETRLVISGYPQEKKGSQNYGIAWYTKEILEPIAKKYNRKFVVLGEKINDSDQIKSELRAKGNILVLRVFNQKKVSLYPQILNVLNEFSQIKEVFVHSEFGMTGGMLHFGLIIPFLGLIKLKNKKINFFAHNVISSVDNLSGHLNLKKASLKSKILDIALKFYYKSLALLCNKIIVLDDILKVRLAQFIDEKKITITNIPVKRYDGNLTKQQAREKLKIKKDQKVLLYFGFLTWYKGADWLMKTFEELKNKKVKLIMAGGPSYTMKTKQHYQAFYQNLEKIAKNNTNIEITGFVDDNDLKYYFKASDVMILPYQELMGASGVLTHALSYQLPFFISNKMASCLNRYWGKIDDFRLTKSDLVFNHSKSDLNKIIKSLNDKKFLGKATRFTQFLQVERELDSLVDYDFQNVYQFHQDNLEVGFKGGLLRQDKEFRF